MLFKFSLYGFLKNQQYYDPFLILVFLEKELSFFLIGLLIGFREICINLIEIPTGVIADLYGRRISMVFSFIAYIISFVIFALINHLALLFLAMFFFSIGEAFRTGTHKAMIFDWVHTQGEEKNGTKVYGYTRSWSKVGSALSALIAGGLVLYTGKYSIIFLFSIIPYLFNIFNVMSYPKYLDGDNPSDGKRFKDIFVFLGQSLKKSWQHKPLRSLLLESTGYEGLFKTTKDYVQPVIKQMALVIPFAALPLIDELAEEQKSAIVIALVYFVLHLLSSLASRHSHILSNKLKGENRASYFLWITEMFIFALMLPALYLGWYGFAVILFVILMVKQNFWRPILLTRVYGQTARKESATILSVESQTKSIFTMVFAPLIGLGVDNIGFWTLCLPGILIGGYMIVFHYKQSLKHSMKVE